MCEINSLLTVQQEAAMLSFHVCYTHQDISRKMY
jgi:hypothetical protein